MTNRICIACDKNSPHAFRFKVNGCEIWQCERCGLGRAETSTFDPKSYYTADYFSGLRGDGYSDYFGAEPVLRREFARSVDFVRRFIGSGRLLDLGCAYGFFLKEARCHFEIFGIELAEHAAASCREEGLNVLSGMANEANMEQIGEVDVITMFDVIEHLPQPGEVLALCYRYLKPGGIIVITTGDFASMMARWAGANWRLMTPPQHLWYFTKESLRRISRQFGLSMEHFDYPAKRVPLSLIVFQLQRMLGVRGSSSPVASSHWYTAQSVRCDARGPAQRRIIRGDRLTLLQILLLTAYAGGMSAGQLLFKMAANSYGTANVGTGERLLALFCNPYFLSALVLYAGLALLWVWILSFTPLSRAYPFVALAFALTPLLAGSLFGETISLRLIIGLLLILGGLFFVSA